MNDLYIVNDIKPIYAYYLKENNTHRIYIVEKNFDDYDSCFFSSVKIINEKMFVKFLYKYFYSLSNKLPSQIEVGDPQLLFEKSNYEINCKPEKISFITSLNWFDITELRRCFELFNYTTIFKSSADIEIPDNGDSIAQSYHGSLISNTTFNNRFDSKISFADGDKLVNIFKFESSAQFFFYTIFHCSNILGIRMKRCINCGKLFFMKTRSDEKYCSKNCRVQFNKHIDDGIIRARNSYRNYLYELTADNKKLINKRKKWNKIVDEDVKLYTSIFNSYKDDESHLLYSMSLCALLDNTVTDEYDDDYIPYDKYKYSNYPLDELVNHFKKEIRKKWNDIYEEK